jgi:DNA (cytosine-5)-methyltransferase 1
LFLENANKQYSFVDLFAGAGGLSLGFKMSGFFEPVAAVESNPKASDTYKANLGIKVFKKEVGKVSVEELLRVANAKGFTSIDAVIGGPPCRPFTTANKGGTRWDIVRKENEELEHPNWHDFWQIIEVLSPKPRVVVAENVMGLKNHDEVFSKFLDRLGKYYTKISRELHAHCFGVPQNRKRLFIAGIKDFDGDPESILPKNPQAESIKKMTVKESISDLPELSNNSTKSPISKYLKGRPTRYQSLLRGKCKVLFDHYTHSVHPMMAERFKYIPEGYNLRKAWGERLIPKEAMHSEYYLQNRKRKFSEKTIENMHSNIYRRLKWDNVSCTITHVRKTVLIHPKQDRLISVREAARLQSFPDWFRFSGSTSQQYQQIADAVPPLLARAVACHLAELLTNQNARTNSPNNSIKMEVKSVGA